jgi:hypothetical protein
MKYEIELIQLEDIPNIFNIFDVTKGTYGLICKTKCQWDRVRKLLIKNVQYDPIESVFTGKYIKLYITYEKDWRYRFMSFNFSSVFISSSLKIEDTIKMYTRLREKNNLEKKMFIFQ